MCEWGGFSAPRTTAQQMTPGGGIQIRKSITSPPKPNRFHQDLPTPQYNGDQETQPNDPVELPSREESRVKIFSDPSGASSPSRDDSKSSLMNSPNTPVVEPVEFVSPPVAKTPSLQASDVSESDLDEPEDRGDDAIKSSEGQLMHSMSKSASNSQKVSTSEYDTGHLSQESGGSPTINNTQWDSLPHNSEVDREIESSDITFISTGPPCGLPPVIDSPNYIHVIPHPLFDVLAVYSNFSLVLISSSDPRLLQNLIEPLADPQHDVQKRPKLPIRLQDARRLFSSCTAGASSTKTTRSSSAQSEAEDRLLSGSWHRESLTLAVGSVHTLMIFKPSNDVEHPYEDGAASHLL